MVRGLDLSGQLMIVTGANTGIGFETYFSHCQRKPSSPEANDPAVASRLWGLSEKWVGI